MCLSSYNIYIYIYIYIYTSAASRSRRTPPPPAIRCRALQPPQTAAAAAANRSRRKRQLPQTAAAVEYLLWHGCRLCTSKIILVCVGAAFGTADIFNNSLSKQIIVQFHWNTTAFIQIPYTYCTPVVHILFKHLTNTSHIPHKCRTKYSELNCWYQVPGTKYLVPSAWHLVFFSQTTC